MNFNDNASTMVGIFAHPDDEIVVSGILIRAKEIGMKTHIICATRGEACRIKNKNVMNENNKKEVRTKELQQSCDVIGISTLNFLDLEDSKGEKWNKEEGESKLLDFLNIIKPDIIITFPGNGGNGHPDHKAISALTLNAFNKYNLKNNARLYFLSQYPESFIKKLLVMRFLPKKVKMKILNKVATEDDNVRAIIKLTKLELKKKLLALESHKSQFPDEKGRYYGLPMPMFKLFSKYECYSIWESDKKGKYKIIQMLK